jgi:hypothetical protein
MRHGLATLRKTMTRLTTKRLDQRTAVAVGVRRFKETFLGAELIAACIENGCHERPPLEGTGYIGAMDMSGGGPMS